MAQENHSPHVLLIDDDMQLVQAVRQYLELENFKVTVLNGGQQAIDWLTAKPAPDVILLDLMMPNIDGFAVLEFIHGKSGIQNIPVIIFTALSGQKAMDRAQSFNVAGTLIKASMNPPDIVQMVQDVLAQKK